LKTFRFTSLPADPIQQLLAALLMLFFLISATTAQQPNSSTPPMKAPTANELLTRALQLYEAGKFSAALKAFREGADAGNVYAMMYLGVMYGSGVGTEVNYTDSMAWFVKAANLGDSQAMTNIGLLYYRGLGQTQDYRQALSWFHKSAVLGNSEGMFNTARCIATGWACR